MIDYLPSPRVEPLDTGPYQAHGSRYQLTTHVPLPSIENPGLAPEEHPKQQRDRRKS